MGDRVAVIKDGYLQQVDTPQRLYDHPVNVFVAAFIGSPSMNLHEASLSGNTLQLGSQTLELDDNVFTRCPDLRGFDGKQLIVGIRPEDFDDAALEDDVTAGRMIRAEVTLTEALGSEIMVHFQLDAPTVDSGDPDAVEETAADAVGRFSPRSGVKAGDMVDIAVAVENLHFFDPESRLTLESNRD